MRTSSAVAGGSLGEATPAGVGPLAAGLRSLRRRGRAAVAPEHLDGQLDRVGLPARGVEQVLGVGVLERELEVVAPGLGEARVGIGLRAHADRARDDPEAVHEATPLEGVSGGGGVLAVGDVEARRDDVEAAACERRVVGDVALGRDERRARLQGLAAAQLDGVPALAVGQHAVDVAPGHQRGGLPRAGAAADGLAPRHVLAQCPRREHAQLLLQRGGVVGVGVDAAARLGDALQLAPRRLVDVEADRLDAHLDAALGDALGDLARRGRLAGVLAVGDEDDRPRARRSRGPRRRARGRTRSGCAPSP